MTLKQQVFSYTSVWNKFELLQDRAEITKPSDPKSVGDVTTDDLTGGDRLVDRDHDRDLDLVCLDHVTSTDRDDGCSPCIQTAAIKCEQSLLPV